MNLPYRLIDRTIWIIWLTLAVMVLSPCLAVAATPSPTPAPAAAPVPPSSAAQKLYTSAKRDLLQIRVLVRSGRSKASVGSGFLIGNSNLVVTNYHVVSQIALEPQTYVAEFIDTEQNVGSVELLAVDVIHDLAVVRVKRRGNGVFMLADSMLTDSEPNLIQGQYLYSMGNQLDLGFTISEGTYNGVINRSLYPQLLFTGSINAGMSGGPNITADGLVAGVNVAKRRDGELVSFLVPVRFVKQLLNTVAQQKKAPADFQKIIGQQLQAHQQLLSERLKALPLHFKTLGRYPVPVWESDQMRCWGRSDEQADNTIATDTVECLMDSSLFISEHLQMGAISLRHQLIQNRRLNAIRFSRVVSASFKNEAFGNARDTRVSPPQCQEMFIQNAWLPMRAVLCVRAYRQFQGLYDFSLLTSSTNRSLSNLQSRFDTFSVSYDNGLRINKLLLEALGKGSQP